MILIKLSDKNQGRSSHAMAVLCSEVDEMLAT